MTESKYNFPTLTGIIVINFNQNKMNKVKATHELLKVIQRYFTTTEMKLALQS